jgi:hypothetical protein
LEESPEEVSRREDLLRVYHSTKESLKLIEDIARGKFIETSSANDNFSQLTNK